jgi:hypothetical protein
MTKHEQISQRYFNAIEKLKELCENEIAIKTSYFCQEMQVANSFFSVLKKIKAIQEVIAEHKEGTIFKFIHKRADNESVYFLSTRVYDIIRTYQKTQHIERTEQRLKEEQQNKVERIKNAVHEQVHEQVQVQETTLNKHTAQQFLINTAKQELIALTEQRNCFNEQIQALTQAVNNLSEHIEKKQTYINILIDL